MRPSRILIVEDEFIIAEHLRDVLERLHYKVVGIAGQVTVALQWVEEQRPDLVLIDIMLHGEQDGIDLATRLRADFQIPFIFITSHTDPATVARAAQTRPYGYLVKPFKETDVYVALEMAWTTHAAEMAGLPAPPLPAEAAGLPPDDGLFVRDRNQQVKVLFRDLLWLQAQGNYTVLHAHAGKYSVYNTLKHVEQRLPAADFIRVHKSHIVAQHVIAALQGHSIVLHSGVSVPVGRTYQAGMLKRLTVLKSLQR